MWLPVFMVPTRIGFDMEEGSTGTIAQNSGEPVMDKIAKNQTEQQPRLSRQIQR